MSNKEIRDFLNEMLLADGAPPLSDEEADALRSVPAKSSPASVRRVRKRFVEKAFDAAYPEPVREAYGSTFGRWIWGARKKPNLTAEAVAAALGKDAEFLEGIEAESTAPWAIPPAAMADIIILFNIHIDALTELLSGTLAHSKRHQAGRPLPTDPGIMRGLNTTAMIGLGDHSPTSTGEGQPPPKIELNEESIRLLKKLRQILLRRRVFHLLN